MEVGVRVSIWCSKRDEKVSLFAGLGVRGTQNLRGGGGGVLIIKQTVLKQPHLSKYLNLDVF